MIEPTAMRAPNARPEIDAWLKSAVARYAAMSPVDKALHDDAQRRSFVRGQGGHDPGPGVLAEEVRRLRASHASLARAAVEAAIPLEALRLCGQGYLSDAVWQGVIAGSNAVRAALLSDGASTRRDDTPESATV